MDTKIVPAKAHAELGASTSSRWMACPGSVRLSRGLPNPETEFSREGTAAHEVGSMALEKDRDANFWLGAGIQIGAASVEVTEEMVEHVQTYVDYCRGLIASDPDGMHWIERPFSLERLDPPGGVRMFGTPDFMFYSPKQRKLYVVDLKYGKGVIVEVTGNSQTRYYALGGMLDIQLAFPELQIDEIEITIVQPRAPHIDGPIRSETLGVLELLEFTGNLMTAAARTQEPNAPLNAGDHCKFCPASARCPAQLAAAQSAAQVVFSDMSSYVPESQPPAPELLPSESLGEMLQHVPLLQAWAKAMWAEAARRLEAGENVPGLKLVPKRAYRKWIDEEGTRATLELSLGIPPEQYEERSLRSPAQIEQLLGKKRFRDIENELVHKVSSGNTVALEGDSRAPVRLLPGAAFASEGTTPNEPIILDQEI